MKKKTKKFKLVTPKKIVPKESYLMYAVVMKDRTRYPISITAVPFKRHVCKIKKDFETDICSITRRQDQAVELMGVSDLVDEVEV